MTPEQYRAQLAVGSSLSVAEVSNLFSVSVLAGGAISVGDFLSAASTLIAGANTHATLLSDVFMAGLLRHEPLGLGRPDDEPARIAIALNMVIGETETPLPRINRIAKSEPLSAAQGTNRRVLIEHDVEHYVLDVADDPCGLCRALDGKPWPVAKPAIQHPGCTCLVLPYED
jgi:hypothetical protein